MRAHKHLPYHWAQVWDPTVGHFVRKDISTLLDGNNALHLNHSGDKCPHPLGDINSKFIIVHSNGVHATLLRFCNCPDAPCKVDQLMSARLFPSTTRGPISAFSFAMLKEYHIHSLQSKTSAYDYFAAIQRLTDNVFTQDVPVSHSSLSKHFLASN